MAHSGPKTPHPDTLAVHAGQSPDPATGARAVPIYQTSSYVFPDTDTAAALFNMELPGHVYSRLSNPTVAVFEERVAALEGGVGAIATASGQAALHLAVATLMGAGGHIVSSASLYGGSHNLFAYTLPRFGIRTSFVPSGSLAEWRAAITPETRLLFGESVGNPSVDVLDIPALAALAAEHGIPLLVDATVTTPYLGKSLEMGAHLVMHSATKFLSGHGVVIGGVLVDGGRFEWDRSGKFPSLTESYAGFHGMVFTEESPTSAFLLRARREGLRDFGACMAPMTAFQILQGMETLHLRMPRHVETTSKIVSFLASHEAVTRVHHPDLASHPGHALAKRLYPRGASALLSFELKGGRDAGKRFIEKLTLFSHLANIGDAKSLVIHPASTTHFRMDDAALAAAGITPGTVRLSIGLEHPDDLIEDLSRALHASRK
ncbi:O-acetylhomoserine aminocarboxypropyltransferase [Usitatibacter palustris]|uniref:O-acetyl-L-homoserine sulfhydrylase n=1 Tax=Usitatibacter palustris TaxID=2732487 RepID=A0A6M4H9D5_9PROT|nr:O-acetylhomoserine aminocarboxypropyltransferase [Usitatibacter palustris]QJR16200.1 O-acetyl-L-homoserine sulfhydrylase [Usitatibacter palustris]